MDPEHTERFPATGAASGVISAVTVRMSDTSEDDDPAPYVVATDDIADIDDDDDAVPSNIISVENNTNENEAITAVRTNNIEELQRLASDRFDFNATCHWEGTPCIVRMQLEGFPKHLQLMGYSVLHVAAIHSSLKTIRFLLENGANIDLRDKNQRTALQLAVVINRMKVAWLLINKGAEINTCSLSGRSPLMEAVMNFNLQLTNLLIASGADVNMPDIKGTTPLLAAINSTAHLQGKESSNNIVHSLLDSGCLVDKANPAGATPLMLAAGLKNVPVIHMLIAAGANVNQADSSGRTAFAMAIEGQRNVTALQALMQYGAATHIPDNKGKTPLDKATQFGSITVLRLLLSADAAPHRYDILTAPRIVQLRNILPEFDAWLHEEFYEPRSLRRLCRELIRRQTSPNNLPLVGNLGLPKTLNNFLLGVEM